MISVSALSRRFGDLTALQNVSFSVASGEIVGFLGPNGAGKTTGMRILTCTLPPSEGCAAVAGHDVVAEPMAVRQRVGFMPENVPLYPDCTVEEHLRLVARLKDVSARSLTGQLQSALSRAGLTDVRRRLVGHLSKGYRQRVGLAQALIGDPPVLILDEPSVGLDPQQIVEIRELIRSFAGEKTVLLSSHILNEVSLICGRVLILDRGRLVGEADPRRLQGAREGRTLVTLAWDGPRAPVHEAIGRVPGVAEVATTPDGAEVALSADPATVRPALAAAVIAAGGRLQRLEDQAATLEDLFLRLTGGAAARAPAPADGGERGKTS